MKKVISLLLALLMAFSLAIPSFAVSEENQHLSSNEVDKALEAAVAALVDAPDNATVIVSDELADDAGDTPKEIAGLLSGLIFIEKDKADEVAADIAENSKYTVKVTDAIGNTSEFSFTIVEAEVGKFDQEIDNVAGFEKVLVNGAEATLDRGSLILTESGTYEVAIVANGVSRTFTVTVDATAPSISLNGVENGGETKDAVIIGDLSEDATVKVTKDGEEIAYKLGDEITEPGEYKVSATDEFGNTSEYSFTIKAGLNGGIIALIVIVSILAVGGVVVFILKKKEII